MKHSRTHWAALTMSTGLLLAAPVAQALELATSGFGTVGYAISDQSYRYQRFIDDTGTFKRDTVIGGQLELKFSPELSATVQAIVAPSVRNDTDWSLTPSWAFLSWRPGNDWLLRVGKQRVSMFLNSENRDVGQTYDFARLPMEMYGISPTVDFTGLSVSHSWLPDLGELTLDVFGGQAAIAARTHSRDYGTLFTPVRTGIVGSVLTLRTDDATWRVGLHHTVTRLKSGEDFDSDYPYVDLGGYFQVSKQMFGPGVPTTAAIANDVITFGGDVEVAPTWRVVGELARNIQHRTNRGQSTFGGYVAVLHKMDRFTPYVSFAKLRSTGVSVGLVAKLDASVVPGQDDLNASQRAVADSIPTYDQESVALGSSYALSSHSKLKAEWLNTRVGKRSAMVDSPLGSDVVRHQRINVLTVNYSFAF
ncbi:MAG: hypothetical protein Q7U28_04085 [Aquabacterium sp.]|nr:hypothetical protein [Aquabacterium sp.]